MSWKREFRQKLAKAREFFTPASLEKTPIKYEPQPGELALLVIDVQEEFCDPKQGRGNSETTEVSKRIKSLIPEFRKAGVPTYVIYFSYQDKKPHEIDFYMFFPDKQDVLIAKNADSAFEGSDIRKVLDEHKRTTLLACGFNLNACVYSTVMDARRNGFDVCVMRDLTGNDNCNDPNGTDEKIKNMKEKGITFSDSATILKKLADKKTAPGNGG
jgi:nicotinamidase-related amidase